jgi:alpha-beta hydrolase superfamily lysophospholipase
MIKPAGFPGLPADFEFSSEMVESLDRENTLFFGIYSRKSANPRRALLMVHGQGEHGGRYQHFPHYLQSVYDVFMAVDVRGHGRSEGIRGHVDRFDEYVDDVLVAFENLQSRLPAGTPIDLFGHSQGGLVVLRTLQLRPDLAIQNLIVSAPLLGLKIKVPVIKELAAKILEKTWGSMTLQSDLDAGLLSHDPQVVKAYQQDRLVHQRASPRYYFQMKALVQDLHQNSITFRPDLRVLFQLAGEDEIVDTAKSEEFFKKLKHTKKELIIYPGLHHEIYNELTKDHVFDDWLQFLKDEK